MTLRKIRVGVLIIHWFYFNKSESAGITDQPILIVGAMVVGPEFSPIAAICFALAHPVSG